MGVSTLQDKKGPMPHADATFVYITDSQKKKKKEIRNKK